MSGEGVVPSWWRRTAHPFDVPALFLLDCARRLLVAAASETPELADLRLAVEFADERILGARYGASCDPEREELG